MEFSSGRLFKWIWSSLLELFKVFFTWIYLIVEQYCGWQYCILVINMLTMLLHKKSRWGALIGRLFKLIWLSLLELFKVFFTWIYLIAEQYCGWQYCILVINMLTMLLHKKSRWGALIRRLFKLIWLSLLELFSKRKPYLSKFSLSTVLSTFISKLTIGEYTFLPLQLYLHIIMHNLYV